MPNPLLAIRRVLELNQGQLGQQLANHISPTYVSNLEEGFATKFPARVYADLFDLTRTSLWEIYPPSAIRELLHDSLPGFEAAYQSSRTVQRSLSGVQFLKRKIVWSSLSGLKHSHPHACYRNLVTGSQMRTFSRAMCINPETISVWEKSLALEPPGELRVAYEDAGMDRELELILDEVAKWVRWVSPERTAVGGRSVRAETNDYLREARNGRTFG